ncbi:DNA replication and repair protein RecF [Patescibacteria group bacterium]|nr:DNA replication and repair protein RecF [Patescibacteria group bacterium]
MFLKSLKLVNWRNYDEASFDFVPGINVIVGENAKGKTNVVEAVVMLATTKSFRVKKDRALIRKGGDFAKISGQIIDGETGFVNETRIILDEKENVKKEIRVDGVMEKILKVIGRWKVVYFSPEEIERFFGVPGVRRRWMNMVLSLLDSRYAYDLAIYKKVVIRRNRILKSIGQGRANKEELGYWNDKWLELAVNIITKRRELVKLINKGAADYFGKLFGKKEKLRVGYLQTCEEEDIEKSLQTEREAVYNKEVRYGSTILGPHREDLLVEIDGVKLVEWGSRAQARIALLSIKLAELDFYHQMGSESILVLDDIFSELDDNNRGRVMKYMKNQQTLVTATDLSWLEDKEGVKIICV